MAKGDFLCGSCLHYDQKLTRCRLPIINDRCPGHSHPTQADAWHALFIRGTERRKFGSPAFRYPVTQHNPDPAQCHANFVINRSKAVESGCWEWIGATSHFGHGRIKIDGRLVLPHRVTAWAAGIIPSLELGREDQYALHSCDIPRCVNHAHLFAGSKQDNMQDCAQKGRVGNANRTRPCKTPA